MADQLQAGEDNWAGALVLGLARGGVPVAFEVARRLELPLDVLIVRKLGVPGHPELAMGAVAAGGVQILDRPIIERYSVREEAIEEVARHERGELGRREQLYRGGREPLKVKGRSVILVDDGAATGATLRAGIALLRELGAGRVVVAVPTASAGSARRLRSEADSFVAVVTPEPFESVGKWYREFHQVSDHEVRHLLETDEADPWLEAPGPLTPIERIADPECGELA